MLIARFRVDGATPAQVAGLDADWVGLLTFAKTFTSGVVGSATTLFMSAGTVEGSRSYVATEQISGRTDDGREGSFTVQHGRLESDRSTWFGHIVPHTAAETSRTGPGRPASSTTTRARTSRSTSTDLGRRQIRRQEVAGVRAGLHRLRRRHGRALGTARVHPMQGRAAAALSFRSWPSPPTPTLVTRATVGARETSR